MLLACPGAGRRSDTDIISLDHDVDDGVSTGTAVAKISLVLRRPADGSACTNKLASNPTPNVSAAVSPRNEVGSQSSLVTDRMTDTSLAVGSGG
jgi:hypothetical protein